MVIIDKLFKNVIFKPITLIIAKVVTERLLTCLIRYYGLLKAIVLDKKLQFVSYI